MAITLEALMVNTRTIKAVILIDLQSFSPVVCAVLDLIQFHSVTFK